MSMSYQPCRSDATDTSVQVSAPLRSDILSIALHSAYGTRDHDHHAFDDLLRALDGVPATNATHTSLSRDRG